MREKLILCIALSAGLTVASCNQQKDTLHEATEITKGDPAKGKTALENYGCVTCHTIPGIEEAHGNVGPSLAGIAGRTYIGGAVPNNPDNLVRWIQNPKINNQFTAMPNVGVTPEDAQDIAAYLYTLR
jgi:cytochrome c